MNGILQDLRIAVRDFVKNPGFALVAIVTLATGIGASTAMFSVVLGVLLAPLPYREPGSLLRVFYTNPIYPKFAFNPTDFLDYRERNRVFESLAVYTESDLELSDRDRPQRLTALRVSSDYFRVLGSNVGLGRDFERSDEIPGNDQVVILSHDLWAQRFAADPQIIGRKIELNRLPFTVIGVAAEGFQHPGGDYRSPAHGATVDAWAPFAFKRGGRGAHFLNGIARLKAGITPAQAKDDMNRIAADLDRESHSTFPWRIFVTPLREEIVGNSQRMLLVLLGSVIFVLLIACVNVAGLLLVRATARSRDMAVRAALGASRARLIRQSFTESMLLALIGAGGGQLLAIGAVRVLARMAAATLPRAHMIRVDPTIFAFTLALSIVTAMVFGVAPAIAGSRRDLNRALHEAGRGAMSGSGAARLRGALVIGEIALASTLLVGSGLFLRSFVNLLRVDPGFQAEHLLTARVTLPEAHYKTDQARDAFFRESMDRISRLPGVRAAGASSDIPWTAWDENAGFTIEGRVFKQGEGPTARYHSATPDYFRAMGIPLLAGRFLADSDNLSAPYVVVVNNSLARKYWHGENAVGKRITFADQPKEKDWFQVVGVVGDVKDNPASAGAEPAFWWSQRQQIFNDMRIVVRAGVDPATLTGAVRSEIAQMDPELPLTDVRTMEHIAGASYSGSRLLLLLTAIFSTLALGLAAIGTYGVIAYGVAQRTHEFGLRIALGAKSWDVVKLVGGQGLRLALTGIATGMLISAALARLLDKLLYNMSAYDPLTFAAAFMGALLVAMLAGYLPAHRATKVDPMISLRTE